MSTRVEGSTALILVTVHATLSAGPAHLMLSAREGPAPGTWALQPQRRRAQNVQLCAGGKECAAVRHSSGCLATGSVTGPPTGCSP
jgi:hypothetical protein